MPGKTRLRKRPAVTLFVIYQALKYFQDFFIIYAFIKCSGIDNFQLMSVHRDCHSYNCNTYSAGHDKLILDKENKICLLYFLRENENTPVELE